MPKNAGEDQILEVDATASPVVPNSEEIGHMKSMWRFKNSIFPSPITPIYRFCGGKSCLRAIFKKLFVPEKSPSGKSKSFRLKSKRTPNSKSKKHFISKHREPRDKKKQNGNPGKKFSLELTMTGKIDTI